MGDLIANRRRLIAASPHLVTTQNASSVYIGEPKIERLAVTFASVQAGSGTPSPSNVRAISGWTEISARICGKNLFDNVFPDEDATVRYRPVYVGDSQVTFSTTCGVNSGGYTVLYAFPGNVSRGADSAANGLYSGNTRTVTPVNGYVTLAYRTGNNNAVPSNHTTQIEVGTTATTIEPFRGITPTASLGSTYYGGTVDLVSGTMTVTSIMMRFDSTNLNKWQNFYDGPNGTRPRIVSYNFNNSEVGTGVDGEQQILMANCVDACPDGTVVDGNDLTVPNLSMSVGSSQSMVLAFPISYGITSLEEGKAWVSEHPLDVVFVRKTPLTVTLTPQAINALRGQQTVSSPAGSVDITYWTY